MHNQERPSQERPRKDRSWWPIIAAAVIGAIATIVGAFVANRTGALYITGAPVPSPTVTVTVSSRGGSAAPTTGPGAFLYSEVNVNVPDEGNLNYKSSPGNQVLFTNWGTLGYIAAGSNVKLAVLSSAVPAANAAYQACEKDTSYKQQIMLNSFPVGSTLCAFTPNNQVIWIRFLSANSSSNALRVELTSWKGPSS